MSINMRLISESSREKKININIYFYNIQVLNETKQEFVKV